MITREKNPANFWVLVNRLALKTSEYAFGFNSKYRSCSSSVAKWFNSFLYHMTVLLYGQEDAGLAPHWHTLQNQVQKQEWNQGPFGVSSHRAEGVIMLTVKMKTAIRWCAQTQNSTLPILQFLILKNTKKNTIWNIHTCAYKYTGILYIVYYCNLFTNNPKHRRISNSLILMFTLGLRDARNG